MRCQTTITIGTDPINVSTGTALAPDPSTPPRYATRYTAQMLPASSAGLGYVMDGIRPIGRVPALATDDDVSYVLSLATSTAPGGSFTDSTPANNGEPGIDIRQIWVHGAHAGDKIKFTWDEKI